MIKKAPKSLLANAPISLLVFYNSYWPFKGSVKSHLPFAGIFRSSPYSPLYQGKG